jgi:hypothetical protein
MITIPVLLMYGSADWLGLATPDVVNTWMHPGYDNVGSSQKARAVFTDAGHTVFMETEETVPWLADMGIFLSDPVWDMDRAHDLINHFTTAFLLVTLKGDPEAAAALAPDAVSFPGITYEAQGF